MVVVPLFKKDLKVRSASLVESIPDSRNSRVLPIVNLRFRNSRVSVLIVVGEVLGFNSVIDTTLNTGSLVRAPL